MKKNLTWIVLVLVCTLALSACGCKHETWNEADCETPKTCAACGETEGEALGHIWADATCEDPKICVVLGCGKTEGAPLGHTWVEATCDAPKTCSTCNLTEGEALGHSWLEATTEAPKTCETCALTEGEKIVTDPRFTTAATAAVQGKWGHTLELGGDMLGEPGFEGTLKYMLILDLGNDGTMSMRVSLEDASEMYAYMTDLMYDQLAASGLNKEQADAAILTSTGMTMDQYIEYLFQSIGLEDMLSAINVNGVYYVDGNQFYSGTTWEGEVTPDEFALEGDTLILKADVAGMGAEQTEFQRIVEEE